MHLCIISIYMGKIRGDLYFLNLKSNELISVCLWGILSQVVLYLSEIWHEFITPHGRSFWAFAKSVGVVQQRENFIGEVRRRSVRIIRNIDPRLQSSLKYLDLLISKTCTEFNKLVLLERKSNWCCHRNKVILIWKTDLLVSIGLDDEEQKK